MFRFSAAEISVFHSGLFSRPLQVVLSFACSVASLSRCPSHYLPGHPHLREDDLAAYPFGKGNPSTWCTGCTAIHGTPTFTCPEGLQELTCPGTGQCQNLSVTNKEAWFMVNIDSALKQKNTHTINLDNHPSRIDPHRCGDPEVLPNK